MTTSSLGLSTIFHRLLDSQALGWGLLLGKDDDFSRYLKESTRLAGVTHLTAASGANIRLFQDILKPLKGNSWLLLSLEIVMVVVYWNLSGASGSLWRASLLALLSGGAKFLGRPVSGFWLLGIVVLVALGTQWRTSLGFWLSWLAILGVYISQIILSGEKKSVLSPHFHAFLSAGKQLLFSGTIVLFFVSGVILYVFGEWQPQGLFGTLISSPVVPLYMLVFVIFLFLNESNKVAQKIIGAEFSLGLVLQDILSKVLQFLLGGLIVIWNVVSGLPMFLSYGVLIGVACWVVREIIRLARESLLRRRLAHNWGW